jgi:hypothetical protein
MPTPVITGDATWRGEHMRKYFMRMENCLAAESDDADEEEVET